MVENTIDITRAKSSGKGLSDGYGVFKGQVLQGIEEREDKKSPHYTIIASDRKDPNKKYRVVVNVKSVKVPPDLRVFLHPDFRHPIARQFQKLGYGFTQIPKGDRKAGGIALDFIRGNLFDVKKMKVVPADKKGSDNDVNDLIDFWVRQTIKNKSVDLYAFGEPFSQGLGVHNIHMNQGNSGGFARENGVYQDGALFFHFRDRDTWIAFFSAFQSQSFHTDDRTGDPIDRSGKVIAEISQQIVSEEETQPEEIRIIAALVHPRGEERDRESVTLINTTIDPIDLTGWSLKDRLKRELLLTGTIQPGATQVVSVPSPSEDGFQLSNEGGIITLIDDRGWKVHGVSYTGEEAGLPGRTLVF